MKEDISRAIRCFNRPITSDQAQSESVGVILLTAVVVIVVAGNGVAYLGAIADDASSSSPLVDAEITATAENISITHGGGETVAIDSLAVVVRSGDASNRYAVDPANVTKDDDQFDPAEHFGRSHGVGGGQLEVLLIHTDSNAVLEQVYSDT